LDAEIRTERYPKFFLLYFPVIYLFSGASARFTNRSSFPLNSNLISTSSPFGSIGGRVYTEASITGRYRSGGFLTTEKRIGGLYGAVLQRRWGELEIIPGHEDTKPAYAKRFGTQVPLMFFFIGMVARAKTSRGPPFYIILMFLPNKRPAKGPLPRRAGG